jgi:hypothetical protein
LGFADRPLISSLSPSVGGEGEGKRGASSKEEVASEAVDLF